MHVMDALPNGLASQHYLYDNLNRLTQWNGMNSDGTVRQQSFGYDSFGNMLSADGPNAPNAAAAYDAGNHLTATQGCVGTAGASTYYDAAGNVLCQGLPQNVQVFVWDPESRLAQLFSEQNNNTPQLASAYSYDAAGQRIRADQYALGTNNIQSWREYSYFNGQMLAEKDQNGNWTDYIYADGKKIAAIPGQDRLLHLSGQLTASWGFARFDLAPPAGYVVAAGDKLCWRQRSGGISGGVGVWYDLNGKDSLAQNWTTADGQSADEMAGSLQWSSRCVDLSYGGQDTGSTIMMLALLAWDRQGVYSSWDEYFADMAIVSSTGAVTPIIGANPPAIITSPYGAGDYGENKLAAAEEPSLSGQPALQAAATHYFVGDQVGTAQLEPSSGGWPLWHGEFAPFGQELDTQITANRFKFTGKERDTESGLDYFGARYYASNMGRWMSPDWSDRPEYIPFSNLQNPQSLNLYAYVGNNPLSGKDPDGHSDMNSLSAAAGGSGEFWADYRRMDSLYNGIAAQQHVSATVNGTSVTYSYPDGSTMTMSGTHPWRDNNPGDLTGGHGAIGLDKGIAIYSSQEDGWNALFATLQGKYKDYSLSQLVNTYNPACPNPCTDPMLKGNNPVKYANDLAGLVGVGVETKLSSLSSAQIMQVGISISQLEGMTNPHIQNTMVWNAAP